MLPYLTPERYRAMGFGTTDQDDSVLRTLITRATVAVDRYLNAPMVPQRYSFRGGSVTGEEHPYDLGTGTRGATHTFWPRSRPLKAVSQLKIFVTNTQFVEFDTDELFVAHDHIGITSLSITSAGLFGSFTVPVIGLAQPVARIDYTYGQALTATDEVLDPTDGRLYRAQNQFWDDTSVVVKKDGSVISTGFTVDKTEGTVMMDDQQEPGTVITASYGYSLYPEIPQAVGLAVAKYVGDKDLVEKGMQGVRALRVGDIEIERTGGRRAQATSSLDLPDDAKQLLTGLEFWAYA